MNPNNRIVITGAPGTGKTTLIHFLGNLGYRVFTEIARELISDGIKPFMPSGEPGQGDFFTSVLNSRINAHNEVKGAEMAFFDRALPDSIAYFMLKRRKVPERLLEAAGSYRYHPLVFVAPPWEEIYCKDVVRTEDFAEVLLLHDLTMKAYAATGYRTVLLPPVSPAERAEFILTELRNGK